jgi:transposase
VIYVGIDWSETHHDVCVVNEAGAELAHGRVPEGIQGAGRLHELLAGGGVEPTEVIVGIETDRGLLVGTLVGAGYRVFAINPFAVSRYRDRHHVSGAKSDVGDAKVLADLVRTDRHNHREVASDSEEAEAIKVIARAHQRLIWDRGREANALRSALREFYPGALQAFSKDLVSHETCSILAMAPTPELGKRLTLAKIRRSIAGSGRTRRLDERAAEIFEALHAEQLQAPRAVAEAWGETVGSLVVVIDSLTGQIARLEDELTNRFETHPDAEILTSLPGLGLVLGARVLAEFGDDPTRYADAKARRNYAGTAPVTRASGTRTVVLARVARNRRLADACYRWAFSSLQRSPGARAFYDRQRTAGKTHHQALRALGNRWVGILHGCLLHRTHYCEEIAWPSALRTAA